MKKPYLCIILASLLVLMGCELDLGDESSSESGGLKILFVGLDETKYYYFGGTRNGVLTYQNSGIDTDDPRPTGIRIKEAGNAVTITVLNTGTWDWVIHELNEATSVTEIASATKNNTVNLSGVIIEDGKTKEVTADFSGD